MDIIKTVKESLELIKSYENFNTVEHEMLVRVMNQM